MATPEQEASAQRLLEILQRQAEEEEKSAERRVARLTSLQDEIEALEAAAAANADSVAQKKLLLEASVLEQQRAAELLQIRKDAAQLNDQALKDLLVQSGILGANGDLAREQLENDRKNLANLDRELQAQRRTLANRTSANKEARKLNSLTNELGNLADSARIAFEGAFERKDVDLFLVGLSRIGDQIARAGKQIEGVFGVSFPNIMSTATEAFLQLDKAQADFNTNFRFGPEYENRIRDTYDELREYGVTATDAGEAQAALIKGVSDFTLVSERQRNAIVKQVAILNELGVSAQTSAAIIQNSIKILGTNVDETDNVLRRLTANAKELGFEQEEYMAAFATVGKDLAKLGSEGEMAFKKLAQASRITGMEISRIVTLTSAFDTFEGAAGQAGKLNAALGGNFVNAMDLMMATDPAERFGMIRDSILDTGLAFDDMSYYQRLFYVDALGLSDVGELAQVLSGDFDDLSGSVMASEESLLAQKEAAKAAKTLQETLTNAIAGNSQELTKLIEIGSMFIKFLANNGAFIKSFVVLLVGLKVAMMGLAAAQAYATITAANLSFSLLPVGLAIGALALAFFLLKDALVIRSPSLVLSTLAAMVPAVASLGQSLNAAIPGLLAFGAGMLMAGGGIFLAANGLSTLLERLDVEKMMAFSVAMTSFVASLAILGSPVGLLALAGIASISLALRTLPSAEALSGLSVFTSNLLALTAVSDKLGDVAGEIEKIGKAIEAVPNEKTIRISAMLGKMESTMLAAASAAVNATSNILQAANSPVAAAAGGSPQVVVKQPIDIYLDKSKIGDFTMDIFADRVIGEIAKAR